MYLISFDDFCLLLFFRKHLYSCFRFHFSERQEFQQQSDEIRKDVSYKCCVCCLCLYYIADIHLNTDPIFCSHGCSEDTLLRTHCCPWCFLGCANWETFVANTKRFWTFFVSSTQNLCPQQMLRAGKKGKKKRGNIYVRNNVSSFARAIKPSLQTNKEVDVGASALCWMATCSLCL